MCFLLYTQCNHLLPVLLQFAVHPPVSLIGNEQDNDVSLLKAEQCAVAGGSVRKDGAHAWPLDYVVEACGDRNGPGEMAFLTVSTV